MLSLRSHPSHCALAFQHLALVIDGAPQVHHLAVHPHVHLNRCHFQCRNPRIRLTAGDECRPRTADRTGSTPPVDPAAPEDDELSGDEADCKAAVSRCAVQQDASLSPQAPADWPCSETCGRHRRKDQLTARHFVMQSFRLAVKVDDFVLRSGLADWELSPAAGQANLYPESQWPTVACSWSLRPASRCRCHSLAAFSP